MEDVAQDPVLNVSERGDRALIGKFEGQDLTHPWAGNVVELCPVGALLSKDFLNKARSWDLDRSASVCPNCSQGCNAAMETRDNVVVRMRPRPNDAVNKFFMCDEGRLNYRWLNRRDRVEFPHVRRDGGLAPVDWDIAVDAAVAAIRGRRLFVLASPGLSNETLFLLARIQRATGGSGQFRLPQGPEAPLAGVADLALRADRAPNGHGAQAMGFARADRPLDALAAGDVLLVADEELAEVDPAALAPVVSRAAAIVVVGTVLPAWATGAAVVLPIANMAEDEGTFTNLRGRVQRFLQAKQAPGFVRPGWAALSDVLTGLGEPAIYFQPSDVFAALAAATPAFAGLSYDILGLRGAEAKLGNGDAPAVTAGAGR